MLAVAAGFAIGSAPLSAAAQEPEHAGEIEGVVRDITTGGPLAGADVRVAGTHWLAVTHGDGSFHIVGVAEGVYRVEIGRLGYRSQSLSVTVGPGTGFVEIELEPSPLNLEGLMVTGAITAHGVAEALRPVNVTAGEELQSRLRGTVAETLGSEPGLAVTSMGPAVSRPVIRGLSGDRVLMLEDGERVGDVSQAGSDHATAVDPSAARRIEVVRGPAALLYGSSALGGVINVIRDEIPSALPHHATGLCFAWSGNGERFAGRGRGFGISGRGTGPGAAGSIRSYVGGPKYSRRRAGEHVCPTHGAPRPARHISAGAGISESRSVPITTNTEFQEGLRGDTRTVVRVDMQRMSTKLHAAMDPENRGRLTI